MFVFSADVPPRPIIAVNVFAQDGRDPRMPASVSPIASRLEAIGRVVTKAKVRLSENKTASFGYASSTGFLVSPCYVLTTAHGVFGTPQLGRDPAREDLAEVNFITSGPNGRGLSQTSGWVVAQGTPFRIFQQDWALIHLTRCEGRRLGWLSFGNDKDAPSGSVSAAGFPGDKDQRTLWYQSSCHLKRFDPQHFIWETDCSISPGSSGSPLFQLREKSKPEAIAMVIMEENHQSGLLPLYSSDKANYALDLHFVWPQIKDYIATDIADKSQK